jgi:hypothetical protein
MEGNGKGEVQAMNSEGTSMKDLDAAAAQPDSRNPLCDANHNSL